jgi:hypothetical protein
MMYKMIILFGKSLIYQMIRIFFELKVTYKLYNEINQIFSVKLIKNKNDEISQYLSNGGFNSLSIFNHKTSELYWKTVIKLKSIFFHSNIYY